MYVMAFLFNLVTVPSLERRMFFLFFLYIHPAGSSTFSFHPSWTRQLWISLINSELSLFFMQWWSAALLVLNRFPWGSKGAAIFPCLDLPFHPTGRVESSFQLNLKFFVSDVLGLEKFSSLLTSSVEWGLLKRGKSPLYAASSHQNCYLCPTKQNAHKYVGPR